MNKLEVQKRVSKNGNPLDLSLFEWDEKTNTFSSYEDGLVLDFKDISNCTFDTSGYCTFNTGWNCTFDTGGDCVIVRRDIFEVIIKPSKPIKICPYNIAGYLIQDEDGLWYKDGVEHVIIDSILSRVIQRKGNVLKVINHNENEESYIVSNGVDYAHGKSIQYAKESLIYKISDRNTDEFKALTLDSVITLEYAIKMYRKITGACESQTKSFVENLADKKESYTIAECIKITKGQYQSNVFESFFKPQTYEN